MKVTSCKEMDDVRNRLPSCFKSRPYTEGLKVISPQKWLHCRRKQDGAEGLWRIGDCLYDLGPFVASHPGGSIWLELTKGTDITEPVEIYHKEGVPRPELLRKFYVRQAKTPRIPPFTFHNDGFYKTLKRRVRPILDRIGTGPGRRTTLTIDFLFLIFVLFFAYTCITRSLYFAGLCGTFAGALGYAAHTFIHQKVQWRCYYMDFSPASSLNWRISHSLSHHLFPNTVQDLEVSLFAVFVDFLTREKNFYYRCIAHLTMILLGPTAFLIEAVKTHIDAFLEKEPLRWERFIVLVEFLIIWETSPSSSLSESLVLFLVLHSAASFYYISVGTTSGHHHPESYHDGDKLRPDQKLDWGIFQLDTTRDRQAVAGPVLSLICFGHHTLHHLFPAVDDAKIPALYPVFLKTLKEFGLGFEFLTVHEGIWGLFAQLGRTKPHSGIRHKKTTDLALYVQENTSI